MILRYDAGNANLERLFIILCVYAIAFESFDYPRNTLNLNF